ncbi:MAG: hypothetical protein GY714_09035 [Desulfobacterales bacterium]|nr:hypothetical protein [Desulfobacterales bacterium]
MFDQKGQTSGNTKTVFCNTQETYLMYEMCVITDLIMKNLRNGVFIKFTPEQMQEKINEFVAASNGLYNAIDSMNSLTKLKLRKPRQLEKMSKNLKITESLVKKILFPTVNNGNEE